LKYHPCRVDHAQLLRRAFVCLFSFPSRFSLFSGVRILFRLPHFARPASRKTELQKNYLSALGAPAAHCKTQGFCGDSRVNFTGG